MPPANSSVDGVEDLQEHAEVDALDGRGGQVLGARSVRRRRRCVKYSSWSTPMPQMPWAVAADDAAGAGLAAGAEDHVGALTDELLGVGGALGGVLKDSL